MLEPDTEISVGAFSDSFGNSELEGKVGGFSFSKHFNRLYAGEGDGDVLVGPPGPERGARRTDGEAPQA